MNKKIISVILVLSMLVGMLTMLPITIGAADEWDVWDGTADYSFIVDGKGTSADTPYQITSAEQWAGLADWSNGVYNSTTFSDLLYFELTVNLDFNNNTALTPISAYGKRCGIHFDGNGHTIKGVAMSGSEGIGLFGDIWGNNNNTASKYSSISNLLIQDSTFTATSKVGAVAGAVSGKALIENIYVDKSVTINATSTSVASAGGIVGYCYGTSSFSTIISDCVFAGEIVSSGTTTGGIFGDARSFNISSNKSTLTLEITNCLVTGKVPLTKYSSGFLGDIAGSTTFTGCIYAGGAEGSYYNWYPFGSATKDASNSTANFTFKNCYTLYKNSDGAVYDDNGDDGKLPDSAEGITEITDVKTIIGCKATQVPSGWTATSRLDGDVYYDDIILPLGVADFAPFSTNKIACTHKDASLRGDGTETSPYLIGTAEDWKTLEVLSESGEDFDGEFIKLESDIDFDGATLHPIFCEMCGSKKGFKGTFDGNGKTLSNFTIDSQEDSASLFGLLDGSATIQNLVVKNATIDVNNYGAVIAGGAKGNATIENIYVASNVTISGGKYIGGIVGATYSEATGLTVKNCIFAGTIKATGDYVAGLIGEGRAAVISYCLNTGHVSGNTIVSGMSTAEKSLTISNCVNTGTISAKGSYWGDIYAGNPKENNISISNCYYIDALMRTNTEGRGTVSEENNYKVEFADLIGVDASVPSGFTARSGDLAVPTACTVAPEILMGAYLEYGASVRIDTSSEKTTGIRWTGIITDAYLAELNASGKTYSFGMIIAPVNYIKGDFTIAELEKLDITTTKYKIVEAEKTVDCDGYVKFYCALGGIKEENLGREFAARIYVCVDGEYTYFNYNESVNARSISYIAGAAFKDLASERSDKYGNAVVTGSDIMYSPYTATQRAVLETYMYSNDNELADDADLRVMSYNVLSDLYGDKLPVAGRDVAIMSIINNYAPAVVGLQEATPNWMTSLKALKGSNYVILDETYKNADSWWEAITGGESTYNASPIMYDSSVLECLGHGVTPYSNTEDVHMRVMSWAEFMVITTGETFVVVNTHWDPDNAGTAGDRTAQAAALKQFIINQTAPVIVLGDFNTKTGNALFTNNGFEGENAIVKDAKTGAETVVYSQNSVDHIFGTANVEFKLYNAVTDNVTADVSDHKPIYADVAFN